MAGPAPKTEKWTARENLHAHKEKDDKLYLLVGGTVEVSDADKQPVLKLASGGGPKTLALDLGIEPCGDPATNCAVWKAAHFNTIVEVDQYNSVEVRWDGKVIASTPVINDVEHGELTDKQANVQNKTAGKKSGSGAGKSPVKKAVKRVVKAVEEIAEGARKAVKKALKTVTRKAPKKKAAAKKTVKKVARKAAKSARKVAKKTARTARKSAKKVVKKAALKKKARRR